MPSSLRALPRALRRAPHTLRGVVASAAAVALALGGVLVLGAAPASAHTPAVTADCQALTVSLTNYQLGSSGQKANTVTVTVDNAVVHTETFGQQLDPNPYVYKFSDPTKAHSYVVDVRAWDDQGGYNGWTKTFRGSSVPCTTPAVDVTSTTCTTVGGTTGIVARLTGLSTASTYRVELVGGNAVLDTRTVGPNVSESMVSFGSRPSGATYTVRVTDANNPYITAEKSITTSSCPQVGGSSAEVQQCTAPGGSAQVTLTPSGFVEGHRYTVRSGSATGTTVGDFVYTNGGRYPVSVAAPATGVQQVTLYVVDEQGGVVSAGPIPVTLEACPTQPDLGAITVEGCTVGATSSDVTVGLSGLTTGRSYRVTLDNAQPGRTIEATGATASVVIPDVAPGTHTVTVTDVASGLPKSQQVQVEACAAVPQLSLTPQQCSVPGGTTSLQADLSDLVASRSYTVTVRSNGQPVSGVADQHLTATGPTATLSFGTLPANASYTVTATDDAAPTAAATSTVRMESCPSLPEVGAISIECTTAGGVGTLTVGAADLASGQVWQITFERQTATGWTVVKQRSNMTSLTSADLQYGPVNPGQTYRVTLASQTTPALNDSVIVPIPDGCASTTPTGQVGGVQYTAGGRVGSLALTGTDTGRLAILALLLVLPGAGLIGFAVLRHRREVGD